MSEDSFYDRFCRKTQEQFLAIRLEQKYSKEWILENYLNTINLGGGTRGVQVAAQYYFVKDVSELSLAECALIAGITKNPTTYNPILNPEKSLERQELVLNAMIKQGYILQEEYNQAILEDVIMLVGSNPEEAHPVVGMQIRQAVKRGCKLIVVDPREIDLAKKADIHLKLKPGTNVAFANGMMHIIIEEGLMDEEFIAQRTEGYEKIREIVKEYTPKKVAEICHISADDLRAAAIMYAKAEKAPIIYCLGVTEHSTGTEGVMSMSNMALLVGKLGREGCGVNPLRGQNNVQGACDMGALPTDFPGYQKITTPGVVEKFEKA